MGRIPLLALVMLVAIGALPMAAAEGPRTLHGTYRWNQIGEPGGLRATFSPTSAGRWEVSFQFTFRGQPHTYTGSAEGSLDDGEIVGTVKNENRRRTFRFRAAVRRGEIEGTHAEVFGDEEMVTGTLTLGS